MPRGRRSVENNPPSWWELSLYDFLDDLPVQGWIWEFMRRARLKEILGDTPVDAMNTHPELEELDPDLCDYYDSYPTIIRQGRHPVFFPPSVRIPGKRPKGFHHQQFSISDEGLNHIVIPDIRIDLNRPDSVILRDFENILLELRESFPRPRRISPRSREWARSHTLQVWDLRQFSLTWQNIANIVELEYEAIVEKVRNAYKISHKYIDRGEWKYLARYVEPE
jgi:hypothetical protein